MSVGHCVLRLAVEIILSIFWTASYCFENLPLSILARRLHKVPRLGEPTKPDVRDEKDKRSLSIRSGTPAIRKLDS